MFVLFCDIWLQLLHLTGFVHAQYGWTPLFSAAISGCVEIAELLLEKGANTEAIDQVQFVAFVH